MIKKNIQLIIHLRSGDFYDITDMVPHVTISGSTTSVSRTLETELLQSVTDEQIKKIGLQTGSSICFYENGKELYRGNVIDIEKSTTSHGVKLTIKDLGFTLGKSRTYKNCVDATPEQVAKEVLKEYKLSVGSLEKTNFKATRYFKNTSPYEIMMTMYTFASKKNKKKYMLDINLDKVSVIERGKALTISFTEDSNITNATHKVSIENMVSSVTVVDKNNNKISDNVNEDLFKIYRKMMNVVLIQDEKNVVTKDMINESYKGEEFTCRLTGYGDYSCKSGHKVHVEDRKTGLIGEFYIDSDKHTWSGGTYRCDLDLNFKNIMDEKESGDDKLNEPETSEEGYSSEGSGASDWGHGITAEMLNKVLNGHLSGYGAYYLKCGNAFGVNPMLAALISKKECTYKNGQMNSYNCTVRNNFGGIKGDPDYPNDGKYAKYPSKEIGIERLFRLLGVVYIYAKKRNNLSSIVYPWAPPNENNTAQYIADIKTWYKKYTGTNWSDSLIGKGVATFNEGKNKMSSGLSGTKASSGNYSTQKQKIVVEAALSKQGKRYVWGATGPNTFDCSGLMMWAHRQAGINIPRVSADQGTGGKYIKKSDMLPGDICWYQGHVMMYIGGNKQVHAPQPGDVVRVVNMRWGGLKAIRRYWW